MDYSIKEGFIHISNGGRLRLTLPINSNIKERIEEEANALFKYKDEDLLWMGLILVFTVGFFFFMRLPFLAIFAVLGIFAPWLYRWGRRQYLKEEIEALLSYLETDPEYLIQREVSDTQQNISGEKVKLKKLQAAYLETKQLFENADNVSFSQQEKKEYLDTLNHLELRIQLRKTKIEFYKKYLQRVKFRKAISMAEDAILTDYDEDKKGVKIDRIKADSLREDILILKPLSDKMKLCESEVMAKQLMEELTR